MVIILLIPPRPIHITSSLYNIQASHLNSPDSPEEQAAFLTHQMMEDDLMDACGLEDGCFLNMQDAFPAGWKYS